MPIEEVRLPASGGEDRRAVVFVPDSTGRIGPGIVLVHGSTGLDDHVVDVAGRFGREGFVVVAPELFEPFGAAASIPATFAALPDRRVVGDLDQVTGWLAARPDVDADRIATVGFSVGGTFAYLLACHSTRIAAVVDFYGPLVYPELSSTKPAQPLEMALNLSAPLLALYGTADELVSTEDLVALQTTLDQFMKPLEIERFEGAGHDFFHETRAGYHEPAARRAWERTLTFLRAELEP